MRTQLQALAVALADPRHGKKGWLIEHLLHSPVCVTPARIQRAVDGGELSEGDGASCLAALNARR
jgi:hypothetical protein